MPLNELHELFPSSLRMVGEMYFGWVGKKIWGKEVLGERQERAPRFDV